MKEQNWWRGSRLDWAFDWLGLRKQTPVIYVIPVEAPPPNFLDRWLHGILKESGSSWVAIAEWPQEATLPGGRCENEVRAILARYFVPHPKDRSSFRVRLVIGSW